MEGYYILYKRMLDMMKIKNCWQILRNFNYSDNLTINEAYFDDSLNGIGQGSSVELSNTTAMFLRKLFSLYSKNGSNLVLNDLNSIFFPCEGEAPNSSLLLFLSYWLIARRIDRYLISLCPLLVSFLDIHLNFARWAPF